MKIQIEEIHLGRYSFTVLDDRDQIISRADGGSAYLMIMLSRMIFEREHLQYLNDQRRSSDALAKEAICRMQNDPLLNQPPRKLPRR